MSQNYWANYIPRAIPNVSRLLSKARGESSTDPEDQAPFPSKPSGGTGEEEVGVAKFEEVRKLQREIEGWKRRFGRQEAEMERLRMAYRSKEHRIEELENAIRGARGFYQEDAQRRAYHLQATEGRLRQIEELLATRSAELTGAQAFLSTTDRLSEADVLGIVRSLNENIYQVAVNLTEEWEKSQSPRATSSTDVDLASLAHVPTLLQLARNRDSTGVTFLLQLQLCSDAESITSRWAHHPDFAILRSVYQQLSGSGEGCLRFVPISRDSHLIEGQAISARWRSLTHTYLSLPPPHPAVFVETLANTLGETGSFSSKQQSLDFVKAVALEGIESIIRLALRLESVFLVDVSSSDMSLLFEIPGAIFDGTRMADEFASNSTPVSPGGRDRIAGVTELGVGKSVRGGPGEAQHTEILLKTKVVLEKDVAGS